MSAIRVFAARRFTDGFESAMAERYAVTRNGNEQPLAPAQFLAAAKGFPYLFIAMAEKMTAEVITALLPELKVIATLSVGTDHIDLEAARRAGVAVLNTPDVLSDATADVAMMLMLNTARRAYEGDHQVRSGQWRGSSPRQMLGHDLKGRRLGILGMGRIGREVAKRATPFGLRIHYHNRSRLAPELEAGAVYHETSDALLAHSDILCLNAPGTPELKGFLDARRVALLPKGAMVINVARGDLVDDDALIAGLTNGHLFGAGLDVYRGEPNIDPRYRDLPNVFLLPHIGSATVETRDAMGLLLLDGLADIEGGRRPTNQVV
jgi:glyoxylate reductase